MVTSYSLNIKINNSPKNLSVYINNKKINTDCADCSYSFFENIVTIRFALSEKERINYTLKHVESSNFNLTTFPRFFVNQKTIDTEYKLRISKNSIISIDFIDLTLVNINNCPETIKIANIEYSYNIKVVESSIFSHKKRIYDYFGLLITFIPLIIYSTVNIIFDIKYFNTTNNQLDNGLFIFFTSGKDNLFFPDIPFIILILIFALIFIFKLKSYHNNNHFQ